MKLKRVGKIWKLFRWVITYPATSLGKRFYVLCDYVRLYKKQGIMPNEYYEFEFEKRSDEFRNSFLGVNEQRFYLDFLNPQKYYILARNKFLSHNVLEKIGVRKSELYCYYQPEGCVLSSTQVANNVSSVFEVLKNKNVDSCVIKTTESSHGDNVIVVTHIDYIENDCILHYFDGEKRKLSSVLSEYPLIFESLVRQTDQLSLFNPSSINTVRFMTTLYPNGEAKIIATFIKIGRKGKCVDNAGRGGNVDACIDIETGALKYTIQYDGWRKIKSITHHPDSGNIIEGVVIDHWQEIKEQVIKFQQSFPYIKAAGWDIAITNEGPLVIEVNDMWDRTGQYFIRRGWRNEIRDCYFAWKKINASYPFERPSNQLNNKHLDRIVKNER